MDFADRGIALSLQIRCSAPSSVNSVDSFSARKGEKPLYKPVSFFSASLTKERENTQPIRVPPSQGSMVRATFRRNEVELAEARDLPL